MYAMKTENTLFPISYFLNKNNLPNGLIMPKKRTRCNRMKVTLFQNTKEGETREIES